MTRVLFVFVDGVGIGPDDPVRNAFTAAPPPTLTRLTSSGRAALIPLDAQLGVPGLPQSGTGQYTLLTGDNGAMRFGRHYGPWVPTALREPLQRQSLLARARAAGRNVAFANAYPEELLHAANATGQFNAVGPLRAGPPLAAAGAGILTRHTEALQRSDAVASEIVNDGWRERLFRHELPVISAQTAGHHLAAIAHQHELTFFAHYSTDLVGHEQDLSRAIAALHLFDSFVEGVVQRLAADVLLIIASDHGNLEDAGTGHTTNPAFGFVYGPEHEAVAGPLASLLDVTPAILRLLGLTV